MSNAQLIKKKKGLILGPPRIYFLWLAVKNGWPPLLYEINA